jgi:hypothetical protein
MGKLILETVKKTLIVLLLVFLAVSLTAASVGASVSCPECSKLGSHYKCSGICDDANGKCIGRCVCEPSVGAMSNAEKRKAPSEKVVSAKLIPVKTQAKGKFCTQGDFRCWGDYCQVCCMGHWYYFTLANGNYLKCHTHTGEKINIQDCGTYTITC